MILNILSLEHEDQLSSLGSSAITCANNRVTLHKSASFLIIRYMNNVCNQGLVCVGTLQHSDIHPEAIRVFQPGSLIRMFAHFVKYAIVRQQRILAEQFVLMRDHF